MELLKFRYRLIKEGMVYWYLKNISPLLKLACYNWLVLAVIAHAKLGIPWKYFCKLLPARVPESSAEQVKIVNGRIYSIVKRSIPKREKLIIATDDNLRDKTKRLLLRDWFCGYVRYPESQFYSARPTRRNFASYEEAIKEGACFESFSAYVPVHGGITLERYDACGFVYGFDCNHYNDEQDKRTTDPKWLMQEVHNMRTGIDIAKEERFEELYFTTKDKQARATLLDRYHARLQKESIHFDITNNFSAMINALSGKL